MLAKLPYDASPYSGNPPPRSNRWKPGQSGNPTGKNSYNSISKALRQRLEADDGRLADAIAKAWIKSVIETLQQGKGNMLQMMLERDEGPVAQLIEQHNTEHSGDPGNMTDAELADAIERLVGDRPEMPNNDGDDGDE